MNKKLSVREAADRAGVSPSLVYAWVQEHRLPHYRIGRGGKRGQIRIDPADLDTFLAALKVDGNPLPSTAPLTPTPPLKHLSLS
jgi:excisionase family DNA binding protein